MSPILIFTFSPFILSLFSMSPIIASRVFYHYFRYFFIDYSAFILAVVLSFGISFTNISACFLLMFLLQHFWCFFYYNLAFSIYISYNFQASFFLKKIFLQC